MATWSYRVLHWPHLARASGFSSEKLASLLGISKRQLQRHFHEIHGLELAQWLSESRLRDARHLLDGTHSVKEVAYVLGFKQPSHFSREFKKLFGATPEQFSRSRFARNPQIEMAYLERPGKASRLDK